MSATPKVPKWQGAYSGFESVFAEKTVDTA
jgi:hypothetical protein